MEKLGQELRDMFELRDNGRCPTCKKDGPFIFTDSLSKKEYSISGLCQDCQDLIFGEEE